MVRFISVNAAVDGAESPAAPPPPRRARNNAVDTQNNAGFTGGGIYNAGVATLVNSSVLGNTADFAGGILNNAALVLLHSAVTGNARTTASAADRRDRAVSQTDAPPLKALKAQTTADRSNYLST
jgi:hypothetical protein